MMILITYDVNTTSEKGNTRLRKVAKECVNYGQRVQNSVFECNLSEAQFVILRDKLVKIIDKNLDTIRFYFLGKNWERRVEFIGRNDTYNVNNELII